VKLNVESKKQPKQLGGVGQTRLEDRGSIPGKDRDFCLRYRVQTGSGAHPLSYSIGSRGYIPEYKAAGMLT